MAKRFIFWKYMLGVKEDQYSFQNEMIDQGIVSALAEVSKGLHENLAKKKAQKRKLVRQKVLSQLWEHLMQSNPTKSAFQTWKNEVSQSIE